MWSNTIFLTGPGGTRRSLTMIWGLDRPFLKVSVSVSCFQNPRCTALAHSRCKGEPFINMHFDILTPARYHTSLHCIDCEMMMPSTYSIN